ncbi:hypothetical protein ABBQ38_011383 [Trebouxia sp. C0009 RCD-2024]
MRCVGKHTAESDAVAGGNLEYREEYTTYKEKAEEAECRHLCTNNKVRCQDFSRPATGLLNTAIHTSALSETGSSQYDKRDRKLPDS